MHRLSEAEAPLRARCLAAASETAEVSEELVASWVDARRRDAESFLRLERGAAESALASELREIETRISALEESERRDLEADRSEALELGQRLRWTLWLGDLVADELTGDPVALVEQELDRAEIRAEELSRLDESLRARSRRITTAVDRERAALLSARLDRFARGVGAVVEESGPLEQARAGWLSICESYQLESRLIESTRRDDRQLAASIHDRVSELHEARDAQLEVCRERLGELDDADVIEFALAAIHELIEQSGSVLSEGGGIAPATRIELLVLLRSRIDDLLALVRPRLRPVSRNREIPGERRARLRRSVRQLLKTRRQTRAARVENLVQHRVETTFGEARARLFENLIMVLIFTFLGMVVLEWRLPLDIAAIVGWFTDDPATVAVWKALVDHALGLFHFIDIAFCLVFQLDFFVRWRLSGFDGRYFLRHFFLESLPALPYGFILYQVAHVEGGQAVFVIRLVRLRALTRMRGVVLLVVRLARVIVFLVRGVDRTVERYRHVLDRDVVLFDPNPLGDSLESPVRRRALALEARRQRWVRALYADLPWSDRARLLPADVALLGAEARVAATVDLPYRRAVDVPRGEVHVERLIHAFLDCDVTRALSFLGRDGAASIARLLRFFDFPGIRSLPVVRRVIPAARLLNPAEAVSAAANAVGQLLQEILGVLRFWGDLSGITTGPQILDRVATAIVTAAKRPAVRLLLFGLLLLLFWSFAEMLRFEFLEHFAKRVRNFLGFPVVVLGLICLVFLGVGIWLKRIAGEALEQYMRIADAQYYPLLKARKFLRLREDMAALYRSVILPECALRYGKCIDEDEAVDFLSDPFLAQARFLPRSRREVDGILGHLTEERDAVALLYRDWLDGPVLHRSDDKTSGQLLGDLTLQEVRTQVLCWDKRRFRKLRKLDLDRGGPLNLGPYFWFRFITESLAIETAKLVMEYNVRCIPLNRRALASKADLERFRAFLDERRGSADPSRRGRTRGRGPAVAFGDTLLTGTFTVFDFLGPSSESDEEVRKRYGDEVLDCLRKDRRGVIRDIFGTRPYHLLPRDQRVLNPYLLYRRYLGGAKILFLPLTICLAFLRINLTGIRQVSELVSEVLGRKKVLRSQLSRIAGFDVAKRKISRMRKPFFMEALALRAAIDVEYLGLRIPECERAEGASDWESDLEFIGALESERRPIVELRNRAVRDLRRFRRLLAVRGWTGAGFDELLDRIDPGGSLRARRNQVMRALVAAFVTDHRSLRALVTAPGEARQFVLDVLGEEEEGPLRRVLGVLRFDVLSLLGGRRGRKRIFERYVASQPDLRDLDATRRRRLRHAVLRAPPELERTLELAVRAESLDEGSGDTHVGAVVAEVARDAALWTRRLFTVRTVQTLTVLDVRSYHDMVWDVGAYTNE